MSETPVLLRSQSVLELLRQAAELIRNQQRLGLRCVDSFKVYHNLETDEWVAAIPLRK